MKLSDLNEQRNKNYKKDATKEGFLQAFNDHLAPFEITSYQPCNIKYPLIFTFGVPRSGTTILTQTIAHCFDVGYVNNFMARFWKAPLTGARLSDHLGIASTSSFASDYGSTQSLGDNHDFGYFWRFWLKKDDWSGVKNAKNLEKSIDWNGLKLVLGNLQNHFGKGLVFKNIFGAYYIDRIYHEMDQKVFFLYIKRDPVENACSILAARKKFYRDPATWWSTMPMEYEMLKECNVWEQVAGQVYFLDRYYQQNLQSLQENHNCSIIIQYENFVKDTKSVIGTIQEQINSSFNKNLIDTSAPPSLKTRLYPENEDKLKLRRALEKWQSL